MYWVGVITAGMTAFYVFRALFLAFFGSPRGHHHPHESPWPMLGPLSVLALLSLGGGYIDVPAWLEPVFPAGLEWHDAFLVFTSVAAGLVGIFLAWLLYVARPSLADAIARAANGLYTLLYNKYYVDEIYDAAVVQPVVNGSRAVLWKGMDAGVIDGIVNGIGRRARGVGGVLRLLQSGNIRSYATWVLLGSVVVVIAIGLLGGVR
jgi:NADH-quinone oxidoreductase subunit L